MKQIKKYLKDKTAKERQRNRRKKLKDADMNIMYVRGKGGYFDERVRVALGIQRIAEEGRVSEDIMDQIVEASINSIPPDNQIDRLFLQKIISIYLSAKNESEVNKSKNTDIFDRDLNPVLEIATSEELAVLVEYQQKKFSESLTASKPYKMYAPDHNKYADLIASELRDFGGNTLLNVYRGEGPPWYEVTCDVAKKVKAPIKKGQPIEAIENSILSTILEEAWEKMSKDERKQLLDSLDIPHKAASVGAAAGLFQTIFKAGGYNSYELAIMVASQFATKVLGRELSFAANVALTRWASILTGPLAMAITSIWTIADLAGPSYQVTIPSVIHVSLLRKKYSSIYCMNCEATLVDSSFKFCPECGREL